MDRGGTATLPRLDLRREMMTVKMTTAMSRKKKREKVPSAQPIITPT